MRWVVEFTNQPCVALLNLMLVNILSQERGPHFVSVAETMK